MDDLFRRGISERPGLAGGGAAGGPDRLGVVQLDPVAAAERLGQFGLGGLDAQPLSVRHRGDALPGQHSRQRPLLGRVCGGGTVGIAQQPGSRVLRFPLSLVSAPRRAAEGPCADGAGPLSTAGGGSGI